MPGEQTWPTQPFPTRPAPFARQQMTVDDLTPLFLTDAERASWIERLKKARSGLFTPLSTEHETIAVPGAVGGANWGNTAANPAKGLVYVMSQDFPSFYKLSETPPNLDPPPRRARAGAPEQRGPRRSTRRRARPATAPTAPASPTAPTLARPRHAHDATRTSARSCSSAAATCRRSRATDDEAMRALWDFVTDGPRRPRAAPGAGAGRRRPAHAPAPTPDGPVVATGGAPGGLEVRPGPGVPARAARRIPMASTRRSRATTPATASASRTS